MTEGRLQAIALLGVVIGWQIYVVISTYWHAAMFQRLFTGLGAEVPLMTRLFFGSYRWWFIVPMIFGGLLVDLARRQQLPRWYSAALVGSGLAAGFLLQGWANEACFGPMFSLIKQIG